LQAKVGGAARAMAAKARGKKIAFIASLAVLFLSSISELKKCRWYGRTAKVFDC
jgi:hypothetical protein